MHWAEAINDEMKSLFEMGVIEAANEKDVKKEAISSTFDLRRIDSNYSQARLVPLGHCQKTCTTRPQTVKAFLAAADIHRHLLHHVSFDPDSMREPIDDRVYMRLPKSAIGLGHGRLVQVKKPFYGLSETDWHCPLHCFLQQDGWTRANGDQHLFTNTNNGSLQMILHCVDDILISAKTVKEIQSIKSDLESQFEIKDLGALSNLCGIQVMRTQGQTYLNQYDFIEEAIRMWTASQVEVYRTGPLQPNRKIAPKIYQKILGILRRIAKWTRPDISANVSFLARHSRNPENDHFIAVEQLLGYLKMTRDHCLALSGANNERGIRVFADSQWYPKASAFKTQLGFVIQMCGRPISWRSDKQYCASATPVEADFLALSVAARESLWMRNLAKDLQLPGCQDQVSVYCDNLVTIDTLKYYSGSSSTKSITDCFDRVQEMEREGAISLQYLSPKSNLARVLCGSVPIEVYQRLVHCMGVQY